jgi:DNA repair protein RecN (Recombination protein N)
MAQKGQCMAISHLPQVAAKAKHHFLVEKYVVDERMQTKVTSLSQANRITELARLLSGESITPAAIENAKSLLAIK